MALSRLDFPEPLVPRTDGERAALELQIDGVEGAYLVGRSWVEGVRDRLQPKRDVSHCAAQPPPCDGGGLAAPGAGARGMRARKARSPA